MRRIGKAASAILLLAPASASGGAQPTPSCAAVLRGSAPTIAAAIASRFAELADHMGIKVEFQPPFGPPQGTLDAKLESFLEGGRDVALLTRAIARTDLATFRVHHAGRAPLVIPVAAGAWNRFGYVDAVVVIVNRANPIRSLSLRQLDGIFSQTRWRGSLPVRRWGDVGLPGSWRRRAIGIAGGGAWAGEGSARALTVQSQVLSIHGKVGRWRQVPGSGDESQVVERVAADPAAIGFTGMGHLTAGVKPIALAIDRRDAIPLTAATAASGRYPLLRTMDLLIASDASGRVPAGAKALAGLMVGPAGQQAIADQGDFAALPPPTLVRSRALVAALRIAPSLIESCRE